MNQTEQLFGSFHYTIHPDGTLNVDPQWVTDNITKVDLNPFLQSVKFLPASGLISWNVHRKDGMHFQLTKRDNG